MLSKSDIYFDEIIEIIRELEKEINYLDISS